METVLPQLLAYLISVAAGLRTSAIGERRQKKLRKALENEGRELAAINNRKSLCAQLDNIGARVGQCIAELDVKDPIEQAIWQLLTDPIFRDDLAKWLTLWDLAESEDAKRRLEERIVGVLQHAGAAESRIATFKDEFFNVVDNLVFEDAKLARWRHHLGLQALKEDQDEILRRLREQDGEYEQQRIDEAVQRYRELTLKTCDIIDMAGLPEDDRHLAMKDFVLRQLYIPLRVNLEGPLDGASHEVSDEDLTAIEERREKNRLQGAASTAQEHDTGESPSDDRTPLGRILETNKRVVVLGDPGSGKTTLVRWLATAYLLRLQNNPDLKALPDVASLPDVDWVPIVVRCRDLPRDAHRCDFDDIVHQALRTSEIPAKLRGPVVAALRQRLENGTALLMIDGLDEIPDPMSRARFCRRMEAFAIVYDQTPIVVTSRIVGYKEMRFRMGRGFRHSTISDLTKDEMDEFARRWTATTEARKTETKQAEVAQQLIIDIHSNERVERLAGNPMLLTTLALVHRKIGRLPQRRVDLYREAVQVLLNWRREIDEPLDWQEAVPQLEYVAYSMCQEGVQRLPYNEVLSLFEEMRKKYGKRLREIDNRTPQKFLELLERRSSILIEAGNLEIDGHEVPVYEFRHLTFQEYLAALAIVDGRFPGHIPGRRLSERVGPLAGIFEEKRQSRYPGNESVVSESWREPLRLCLAACNDDDVDDSLLAILRTPKNEDRDDTARPRAIMAALCIADEPNVSEEVVDEALREFVQQVVKGDAAGEKATTALSGAAVEVGRSVWWRKLEALVVDAYITNSRPDRRGTLASLVAMMSGPMTVQLEAEDSAWTKEFAGLLSSKDDRQVARDSLVIMHCAFVGRMRLFPGVIESLIIQVGHPKRSHAAAWALWWLSGGWRTDPNQRFGRRKKGAWSPNDAEVQALITRSQGLDMDGGVNFVLLTLGNSRSKIAVEAVRERLGHPRGVVRNRAIRALVQLLELDKSRLRLLTTEFDVRSAYIDLAEEIDAERVTIASRKLKLSETDVRTIYEELAPVFKLRLQWKLLT